MNNKVVIGIGIGCLLLCAIVGIGFLLLTGFFVKAALEEPENVEITLTAPIEVAKGEDFIVEVEVANLANTPQELNSIDIDLSYLEGARINKTEPPYTIFSDSDFIEEYHSYYFKHPIPANDKLTVKFYMTALKTGDFSGVFDVCINSASLCTEQYNRIIITE